MIKKFLELYNSVSLIKKFILPPIIGSFIFIIFYIYILLGTNYIKQDISYNMTKLAPLYISLIKNEAILEKLSHHLQQSVNAKEIGWLEEAKLFQKDFYEMTKEFKNGSHQNEIKALNENFDIYYKSALEISKQIIQNNPSAYENSSLVVKQYNQLNNALQALKKKVQEKIKNNISHVFLESNNIMYNTFIVFLFVLFISAGVILFIYKDFQRKIKNILEQSNKIANSDLDLNQRLVNNSNDELAVVINSINLFIEKLEVKTKAFNTTNEQLDKKQLQLHSLINSIDEGIIQFDATLELSSENYSQRTFALLGERLLIYKKLDEVLYENEEDRDLFNFTIDYLKDAQSVDDINQYFSLLKNKVVFNSRYFKLKFKALTHEKFMLVIEDITESQNIKNELELEKNNHKMVIHILEDKKEFFKLIEDFTHYMQSINSFVFQSVNAVTILQKLHTYKGMFLQFRLDNVANAIHEIELELKEYSMNLNTDSIIQLFNQYKLEQILKNDLEYINSILGHDLIDSSAADLKVEQALKIRAELQDLSLKESISQDEIKNITQKMYFLDGIVLYNKIEGYYDNIQSFAQKQNLLIDSTTIDGDKSLILPSRFNYMLNSLIHVYRNIVAHGIESPAIREEKNKTQGANINTKFVIQDNALYLSIKDDGQGIDIIALKEKLLSSGILNQQEIDTLDEQQLIQYIFKDKISTKDHIDLLSGQGVGLSSIYQEVQILKGDIEVKNKPNEGLEFIFMLPLI